MTSQYPHTLVIYLAPGEHDAIELCRKWGEPWAEALADCADLYVDRLTITQEQAYDLSDGPDDESMLWHDGAFLGSLDRDTNLHNQLTALEIAGFVITDME